MDAFRHGRVLFAGDSAHGVSPFGARGANSRRAGRREPGLEARRWCCAAQAPRRAARQLRRRARIRGRREHPQLDPRHRLHHAQERDQPAVPRRGAGPGAATTPFARTLVNSGRLSVPATLHASPLNTPDADAFDGRMVPGAPAADAPVHGRRQRRLAAARTRRQRLHRAGRSTAPSRATLRRMRRPLPRRRRRCRACRLAGDVATAVDRASPPSATTRRPAPSTCCAPTSMSARAGASRRPPTSPRRCAARWRCTEQETDHEADHRPRTSSAPDDFYEALIDAHRDLTTDAEPRAERAPRAAAGQPHRRARRAARGAAAARASAATRTDPEAPTDRTDA